MKWIVSMICAGAVTCQAATYYVAPGGDDARTGTGGWTNALATISNAVALAGISDTVLVSNGTYSLTTNIYINKAITVRGLDAPTGAVISTFYPDVNYSARCVRINSAGAVFDGFTVEKGYPDLSDNYGMGAGIWVQAGVVTNCVVRHCISVSLYNGGGGMYLGYPNSLATDCVIVSNQHLLGISSGGGGVAIYGGAQLRRSVVRFNYRVGGGGGVNVNTAGTVTDCTIADNWVAASAMGAGLAVAGAVTLDACIISNNTNAIHGGGVYVGSGTSAINNCIISYNQAANGGGGLLVTGNGLAVVSNTMIACNRALYGAGVANNANTASYGTLDIARSRIVANTNRAWHGAGVYLRNHSNLNTVVDCVIASNVCGTNNIGGGIYTDNYSGNSGNATSLFRNCLVRGNRAPGGSLGRGGGVYIGTGITEILSCTIVENEAGREGGGIYVVAEAAPDKARIWNTAVAANLTNGGSAAANTADLYLPADGLTNAFYYSCSPMLTNAAQGNITNAPVFAAPGAGDFRLTAASPGVNAGTNQDWMAGAADLDGWPRVDRVARRVDIGSYEYIPPVTLFMLR